VYLSAAATNNSCVEQKERVRPPGPHRRYRGAISGYEVFEQTPATADDRKLNETG
jgi:hypothetical protein